MKPRIFGVDPGTLSTGYAVIEEVDGRWLPLDFGCIQPPIKIEIQHRYLAILNALHHLMERYRPEAVAVETQFLYKNFQSVLKLGMARGVVLIAAAQHEIPLFEYAPTKVKLALTGKGSASKEQVQRMTQVVFNLPQLPPKDAADALALALCHAHTQSCNRAFLE